MLSSSINSSMPVSSMPPVSAVPNSASSLTTTRTTWKRSSDGRPRAPRLVPRAF
jgi:hypothetical protein